METKLHIKSRQNDVLSFLNNTSMVHNKKIVKHALRQQVKRRKKNTTIAAGNLRSLPRISQVPSTISTFMAMSTDQSLSGLNDQHNPIVSQEAAATMKEVLASLPGFSFKSNRRRSSKKLSTAAQLEAGLVDLESPASILSNISLRVLLNRHSFQGLPPLYQRKLAQLLPIVDRQEAANVGLNNEFFARACQEWRKRLAEGEFTPENQQKLRLEAEKDKSKLDPWKLKHFEPFWGEKRDGQRIKSTYNCFSRDQKYQKNIFQSGISYPVKSDERLMVEGHESFSESLDKKIEQNLLSAMNNVSNKASAISVEDERDISEFNVTVDILEDDEDDEDRVHDEDEIGDDECDDDEDDDDEEDDDVDDDESDDDYEEEDEEDEFYDEDDVENDQLENRIPLTYLDEEAQHCGEIVVGHVSNEETYNQNSSLPDSFRCNIDNHQDISVNMINDTNLDNDDQKIRGNQSKLPRPPEESFSYQMKIHTYEQSLQKFKSDNKIENDHLTTETCNSSSNKDREGMPDTYEEISACSEEVIYPILEDMEMNSSDIKISEASALSEVIICQETNDNSSIQEEAFQEANNYVCSEMLDSHWESHSRINVGAANKDELPWVSVTSDVDSSVLRKPITTLKNKLYESQIITSQKYSRMISRNDDVENRSDAPSYIQLPLNQMPSDGLKIGTPISSCMMKNFHTTQNPSILSFPQIQSIRFVQTNFQTTLEHNSSESINSIPALCSQTQDSIEEDNSSFNNETNHDNNFSKHIQSSPSTTSLHAQNSLTHNTVVFQQQSIHPLSSHQLITTLQQHHQSHVPLIMNMSPRSSRTGMQSGHRFSRIGNKEPNSSRSRNITKEPPGAVNLERSYQICQAVIASSPNRDQLKAHLKPPPSLLTKNEKSSIDAKNNYRLGNINKRKFSHPNLITAVYPRKDETSPLKRSFRNSHLNKDNEIMKKNDLQSIVHEVNYEDIECCKFVKKFEVDLAPRASSAPPVPPPIIPANLFKGRPASAGERSHDVVSLKFNNESYCISGGSEPSIPDMIIGSHPPSPCECNIQEAMVICRQCGAFCHYDCIGLQCVCANCLIP